MSEKLGIFVATGNNMTHVLGLTKAARAAGKDTEIFLSADGVHLTQDDRMSELIEAAGKVWVCEVSYIQNGYKGKEVPGLVDRDFSIQARNSSMVDECDRYLVL